MVLMSDPWADLRGVPVPIRERCGATTKSGEPCRADGDLCGLHPRVRRFPYKRHRPKPDGRTQRARRNRAELREALEQERRERDRTTAERVEHSDPPETPGPERAPAARSQSAAPPARQPTRGRPRQPPARDDALPYRYRSARLRHLNPGERRRPAEREYDPPDGPPEPGDGVPVAV